MSHNKTINEKSNIVINRNDRLASDNIGFLEKQYDLFGTMICDDIELLTLFMLDCLFFSKFLEEENLTFIFSFVFKYIEI